MTGVCNQSSEEGVVFSRQRTIFFCENIVMDNTTQKNEEAFYQKLEEENEKLKDLLHEAAVNGNALIAIKKTLDQEIQDHKSMIEDLRYESRQNETYLSQAEAQNRNLQQHIDFLQSQNSELQRKIDDTKTHDNISRKIGEKTAKNIARKNEALTKEVEAHAVERKELCSKLNTLQSQLNIANRKHKKELKAANDRLSDAKYEIQRIAKSNDLSKKVLTHENKRQAQEIKSLQEGIAQSPSDEVKRLTNLINKWKAVAKKTEDRLNVVKQSSEEAMNNLADKLELQSRELQEAKVENATLSSQLEEMNTSRQLFHFTAACVVVESDMINNVSIKEVEAMYEVMMDHKVPSYYWYGWIQHYMRCSNPPMPKTTDTTSRSPWKLKLKNFTNHFIL